MKNWVVYMLGSFKEIDNINKYNVIFIYSKYAAFKNYIVDKIKHEINKEVQNYIPEYSENIGSLSFTEYIKNVSIPFMFGKWYCNVNYSELSKSDKDKLFLYTKNISTNGILVVVLSEYKDYLSLSKLVSIKNNEKLCLYNVSFPSRNDLKKIITDLTPGISWQSEALDNFILRIADKYNEIGIYTGKIKERNIKQVNEKVVKEVFGGVENYVFDTLIKEILLMPTKKANKVFRVYSIIKNEMSSTVILSRLSREIESIKMARMIINDGYVPGSLPYNAVESINRVNSNYENKICEADYKGLTDRQYKFRKYIKFALLTTLRDIYFIENMIDMYKAKYKYMSEDIAEACIINIILRGMLSVETIKTLITNDDCALYRVGESK